MNQYRQVRQMNWFLQIHRSASLKCPAADLIASKGGNNDNGSIGLKCFNSWQDIQAAQTRHPNIGNDEIKYLPGKIAKSLRAVISRIYFVPFALEKILEQVSH